MKRLGKMLAGFGVAALFVVSAPPAEGWWGRPWHGGGWRHAYVYSPAYRWGSPATRQYLRDLHLYGPTYAQYKRLRRWWW
jgi:hypothetical protein